MVEESLLSGARENAAGVQQETAAPAADAAAAAAATDAAAAAPAASTTDAAAAATEGGDTTAGKEGSDNKGKPEGAPEKYEFTLPEGLELDPDIGADVEAYAKDLSLPQEKAQKLVDIGVKFAQKLEADRAQAWADQRKAWRDEIAADPEFAGKSYKENLGYAARAIDQFAPELREVLDASGWGDNPLFVKAFTRIGKAISEDRLVGGSQREGSAPRTPENVLYPSP